MSSCTRTFVSLLLMALMTATAFVVMVSAPAAADTASADGGIVETGVTGSSGTTMMDQLTQRYQSKLDPVLAEKVTRERGPYMVYVLVGDRQAVNDYLGANGLPLVNGKQLSGLPIVSLMELDAKQITALAKNPGVFRIMTYEKPVVEPVILPADEESVPTNALPPQIEDYNVDVVHGAGDAWDLGYSGEGIKIAVVDTGFDLGHPDLQGQQARYEDLASPYYGWPIAYDDVGAMYWSDGEIGGWIANTSTEVTALGDYVYFDGMRWKVSGLEDVAGNPVTSQSGTYHIGYHTDENLASIWGMYVGVLVVDSTTPGEYDTVYVDVTADYDFTNDKACTKGDEISYFDCTNESGVLSFSSWDFGDGFADLSGGMVYWISDGVNVLPGSDWTWGATYTGDSGDAVAFMGEFTAGQSHGTMTASAALAVGRSWGGMLGGMAPNASLIAITSNGNMINDWMFAELGADGLPNTGDEANIVSNSYGYSDTAVDAGYELLDQILMNISLAGNNTLWFWSAGNAGPGYGPAHTPCDINAVHVGAGTTWFYRYVLGSERYPYQMWGDVAPFSSSGVSRTGKLNVDIVASGMYSLNPAPLNEPDYYYSLGNGSRHFQLGSGTSHASPTAAGGAALGFEAWVDKFGFIPKMDYGKTWIMMSADDMHNDPLKQGAGWLNASRMVHSCLEDDGVVSTAFDSPRGNEPFVIKAALYPGAVYGTRYETFPNFIRPGEWDDTHNVWTWNLNPTDDKAVNVQAKFLNRTYTESSVITTTGTGSINLDITSSVPATTDLLRVTMWIPMSEFDPELDYSSNVLYYLRLLDWVDINSNGLITSSELFRCNQDYKDANYQQVTMKDPIERIHDGLVLQLSSVLGSVGIDIGIQIDCYELQPFPWIKLRMLGDTDWEDSLSFTVLASHGTAVWEVNVSVPGDAPIGTYEAAIYVEDPERAQCIPVLINVPASDYEFSFGGASYFETPYNNNMTGLADKGWRFDTGDWRMYWCLPTALPSTMDEIMIVTANWTELPTDVNIHVLAPFPTNFMAPYDTFAAFNPPYGPGFFEVPIASSNEKYLGAGVFGVWTSTGGPSEVIAGMDEYYSSVAAYEWFTAIYSGSLSPFAVLLRCPVMAGNGSSDSVSGFTKLVNLNDFAPGEIVFDALQPGNIPLEDRIPAWYDLTTAADVEVKGGGIDIMMGDKWPSEAVWQDSLAGSFQQALANARYTKAVTVGATNKLYVAIEEVSGCPDLDLGLWYDWDGNGVADMYEPYWYVGVSGSSESLTLEYPTPGVYLVKVLGYSVSGNPGRFSLTVAQGVPDATIVATDLESIAGTGVHDFNVSYDLPARAGVYVGAATFGLMGSADMFRIPVEITLIDAGVPYIENLLPVDGSFQNTATPTISFQLNDSVFYSGLDHSSVSIVLDGQELADWAMIAGDSVSLNPRYALAQGYHVVTVSASDKSGNGAIPVTSSFEINSVIEAFSAEFRDPVSGDAIPDGSTVRLSTVAIIGWTDPNAEVRVIAPSGTTIVTADPFGFWGMTALALNEGTNVVTMETTNNAKVFESIMKSVISDMTCLLAVDPTETPTAMSTVDITGWTDSGAHVTANGVVASVASNGRWGVTVPLTAEGLNSISVSATDALGNPASTTVNVVRDTTPPTITLGGPGVYYTVQEPSVGVWGTTEVSATVHVNGLVATRAGTAWNATVVLSEGNNSVTVRATDVLGNSATTTIWVVYDPPVYVIPAELAAVQTTLQNAIDDLSAALLENVTSLRTDIVSLQGRIDALGAALGENVSDLQGQIDAVDANVSKLQASLAENVTALNGMIDELENALGQNVTVLQAQMDAVKANITALQTALQQNVTSIQGDISDIETALDQAQQDISDVDHKAKDTDAFASMLMYLTLILFAIAIVLVGLAWYMLNGKIGGGPGGAPETLEEVDEEQSEVEREFEALEKEIKNEEI